jgi:hypothetical protein
MAMPGAILIPSAAKPSSRIESLKDNNPVWGFVGAASAVANPALSAKAGSVWLTDRQAACIEGGTKSVLEGIPFRT